MSAAQFSKTYSLDRLVVAGVPLLLARWYHLCGRNLREFSIEDRERMNHIRWCVIRFG
ncbi:MAG: hypothetical protein KIT17_01155 [Rubrivivax sp.]|nr:hypothetical protein [Rubrivivax sp.]